MKKIRNILLILLGILLFLNVLVVVLLNIPAVQQKIADMVLVQLRQKIKTDVSIGKIRIDFFKGVVLEDVYLSDQKKDTLLYAGELSANFSLFNVYRNNTLTLHNVSLENFKVYLNKDSADAPFNYQFIIDAFASPDTVKKDTTPSAFDLYLSHIELINGTFKYDVFSKEKTPGLFDASHIHVRNLNGELALHSIKPEKISGEIIRLAASEESGLELRNLKTKFANVEKIIHLDDFEIELPQSKLALSDVRLDYSSVAAGDTVFMNHAVYNITIEDSKVVPSDLKFFLPRLGDLTQPLRIEGHLDDTIPSLKLDELELSYANDMSLALSLSMSDWNDYKGSRYAVNLSHLLISPNGIRTLNKMVSPESKFPDILTNLGVIGLKLNAVGRLPDARFSVNLSAKPGRVSVEGHGGYFPDINGITAAATIKTDSFDLRAVLDTSLHLGKTGLNMQATIRMSDKAEPDIFVKGEIPFLTYQDYVFHNIKPAGHYRGKDSIDVRLAVRDTNVNLYLAGRMIRSADNIPEYSMKAHIRNLNPSNLKLTQSLGNCTFGTNIDLKISGDKLENLIGYARLDSLNMIMDTAAFFVNSIRITADKTDKDKNLIKIASPFLQGSLEGTFNLATLAQTVQNILHPYLPTFIEQKELPAQKTKNSFTIDLTVGNTEELTALFQLPVTNHNPATLKVRMREDSEDILLDADIPDLTYNNIRLKKTTAFIGKKDNMYIADAHVSVYLENRNPMDVVLHTELENDVALVDLKYNNKPAEFTLEGELKTLLSFKREENEKEVAVTANFLPSDLTVNDLAVEFDPAIITMKSGKIHVSDFGLRQNNRSFLDVNGTISDSNSDTLKAVFTKASITSLLGGINMSDIPVNGLLNGEVYLSGLLGNFRIFTRDFHIDDIVYKSESIGSLTMNSIWDDSRQGMGVRASLSRENEETSTARGFFSPARDIIQFTINLQMFPVDMAQDFLKGAVHGLTGYCGANMTVGGKLSSPDVNGYLYLKDVKATVDYTNVTYSLSDTIRFTPTTIEIKDLAIRDNNKKSALLNCSVRHKGFSNITYNASLKMENFLLLNNAAKTDSLLYGTFKIGGSLSVKGDLSQATISGNLKNSEASDLTVRLPQSAAQAQTYSTIVYVSRDTLSAVKKAKQSDFSVKANVAVEITNNATFGVIINAGTGDEITARGSGNINVQYDSDSNIRLFGQYTIDDGHLKVKLSQLPSKLFAIKQGSRIILNGDPMASSFDITAGYRLRADLATLDASFSTLGLSSTRVPVECVLHITGDLSKMNPVYEITLPDSNDDLNRMITSIINTDDLRIKEFAYLIAFNSFFPSANQTAGGNVFTSLASSSLSSVLNNALSGVLGKNWTIGTDVSSSQEDFSDVEVNVSLSTQLFNDRLILNTNLGYRNSAAVSEQSPWVGDFDIEYKLTKSGMIRAKAYNHTNNEIFRTSNTTQGIGVVFTKDSKTFRDLFILRRKKTSGTQTEKTDAKKE